MMVPSRRSAEKSARARRRLSHPACFRCGPGRNQWQSVEDGCSFCSVGSYVFRLNGVAKEVVRGPTNSNKFVILLRHSDVAQWVDVVTGFDNSRRTHFAI